MTFPSGENCSRKEWQLSDSIPQLLAISKLDSPSPVIKNGIFGRKINNCSIDQYINGINLIVLQNLSVTTLRKLQKLTQNLKEELKDNLGWKDRILAYFDSKSTLTTQRMIKLDSLIKKIATEKTVATYEARKSEVSNPVNLTKYFNFLGLDPTANGFDLHKAYWKKGYSKNNLLAYHTIVPEKKWSLPKYTVQKFWGRSTDF